MIYANPGKIDKFFREYKDWVEEWRLQYRPNLIWNTDECRVSDVPKSRAVVGVRGERTFQTVSKDKGKNTTIAPMSVLGGGSNAPSHHFQSFKSEDRVERSSPSGYYLRKSESGYINADLFYESAEKFVEFLKEKKILVGQVLFMEKHSGIKM